jgi:pyruvate/2-oxoglutarate dehydrogenase complex dihydrolipoamide dehydrogenase (E3) component
LAPAPPATRVDSRRQIGKQVALVERKDVIGRTCINTGTIPSKTMREAVLHLSGFLYQVIYGVNYRSRTRSPWRTCPSGSSR